MQIFYLKINRNTCTGCNICVVSCPINFNQLRKQSYLNEENAVIAFTERDTIYDLAEVEFEEKTETIEIVFIKQKDGSYLVQPIETILPIIVNVGNTVQKTGSDNDSITVIIDGQIKEETK